MEKTEDQKRAEVITTSNGTVLTNDVPQTTVLAPKFGEKITKNRDQDYTKIVQGIKAQVKDINGEGSVFDDFATDILENVVKPLYNKTGDN